MEWGGRHAAKPHPSILQVVVSCAMPPLQCCQRHTILRGTLGHNANMAAFRRTDASKPCKRSTTRRSSRSWPCVAPSANPWSTPASACSQICSLRNNGLRNGQPAPSKVGSGCAVSGIGVFSGGFRCASASSVVTSSTRTQTALICIDIVAGIPSETEPFLLPNCPVTGGKNGKHHLKHVP